MQHRTGFLRVPGIELRPFASKQVFPELATKPALITFLPHTAGVGLASEIFTSQVRRPESQSSHYQKWMDGRVHDQGARTAFMVREWNPKPATPPQGGLQGFGSTVRMRENRLRSGRNEIIMSFSGHRQRPLGFSGTISFLPLTVLASQVLVGDSSLEVRKIRPQKVHVKLILYSSLGTKTCPKCQPRLHTELSGI